MTESIQPDSEGKEHVEILDKVHTTNDEMMVQIVCMFVFRARFKQQILNSVFWLIQ